MAGLSAPKQLKGTAHSGGPTQFDPIEPNPPSEVEERHSLARNLLERRIVELMLFVEMLNSESVRDEVGKGGATSLVVEAVRYAVNECGIGAKDLSDFTQTTQSTVSRWVNGKAVPNKWHGSNILSGVVTCLETKIEQLKAQL